jgi:hypothetical protein
VLQRLTNSERSVQRAKHADHQTRRATADVFRMIQLGTDDRELTHRRVQYVPLQLRTTGEHESENRR